MPKVLTNLKGLPKTCLLRTYLTLVIPLGTHFTEGRLRQIYLFVNQDFWTDFFTRNYNIFCKITKYRAAWLGVCMKCYRQCSKV
jgi:hypothetical protein